MEHDWSSSPPLSSVTGTVDSRYQDLAEWLGDELHLYLKEGSKLAASEKMIDGAIIKEVKVAIASLNLLRTLFQENRKLKIGVS